MKPQTCVLRVGHFSFFIFWYVARFCRACQYFVFFTVECILSLSLSAIGHLRKISTLFSLSLSLSLLFFGFVERNSGKNLFFFSPYDKFFPSFTGGFFLLRLKKNSFGSRNKELSKHCLCVLLIRFLCEEGEFFSFSLSPSIRLLSIFIFRGQIESIIALPFSFGSPSWQHFPLNVQIIFQIAFFWSGWSDNGSKS